MSAEGERRMTERSEADARDALSVAHKASRKIKSHEEICSIRYDGIAKGMTTITDDIKTLSTRMWIASGSVIVACLALIAVLFAEVHK